MTHFLCRSPIIWAPRWICRNKSFDSESCTICWKLFWRAALSWVCLMTASSFSHSKRSFFPQVIWSMWCNLQKWMKTLSFWFLSDPVCNITRHMRMMKSMNSNCRSNQRWSATSTRSEEAQCSFPNVTDLNCVFPLLVESLTDLKERDIYLLWINHGYNSLSHKSDLYLRLAFTSLKSSGNHQLESF